MLTKTATSSGLIVLRKALFSAGSAKFPRHRDLFTEDYYDENKGT